MIDIHCHLLPGIDDGPRDELQALELARALVANGVSYVVCTPHIYAGVFDNTRAEIQACFSSFEVLLKAEHIPLQIAYGAEVRLCGELILWARNGDLPYLGEARGRKTLLIELPDGQVPLGTDKLLFQLCKMGIQPVVVHPERNKQIMMKPALAQVLVDAGAKLQVTASSVIGMFGKPAQDAAATLLKAGLVSVIASDSHNTKGRAPKMREAGEWIEERFGADAVHHMFVDEPGRLCGLT